MKFNKINQRKIILVAITGFILISITGCKQEIVELKDEQLEYNITQGEESKQSFVQEETVNQLTAEQEENDLEEVVSNPLTQMAEEVNSELVKEANETSKNKMKQNFITAVDFVFYGTQINGYTFQELTDQQKQDVLQIIDTMDQKIMQKYPTYKDDISSATKDALHTASELIKKGASNINDFAKEKLGEDNYKEMIEGKDKLIENSKNAAHIIGDTITNGVDAGKEKVKNWYENFKKTN